MTFRHRILLDRWLAAPLMVALNGVVRLLGLLLRRTHIIRPETTRVIAICKLVGMGSLIQATPLLRALKHTFPTATVTFITLQSNRDLLSRLEGVDHIVCLDDRNVLRMAISTSRALVQLGRLRIDHYFDLEVYSAFSCLLSVFSLARNRLGFYRHSNRFKRGIYTHLVYFNTRMPVRRLYLQLARVAGAPEGLDDRLGSIRVDPADESRVREKLARLGLDVEHPYLVINPNASDLLLERRWPVEYVVQVIDALARRGHRIVLIGSRAEVPFVRSIVARVPACLRASVVDTAGQLMLGEALALLRDAACVLTNDTGPMHMAFALSRPTVCLIGPADPVHYGYVSPQVVTLYAKVACSPCIYEIDEPPCNGHNVCMQRLMPDLVLAHVLAILEGSEAGASESSCGRDVHLPVAWADERGKPLGIVVRGSVNAQGR